MSPDRDHFWKFGLIGFPLGHSLSPELHSSALLEAQLSGEYLLYAIPPTPEGEGQIKLKLDLLRMGELDGLNVTIPHKKTVIPFVDRLTLTAESVGAVNTLFRDQAGLLVGDNTDVPGFWKDVTKILPGNSGRKALILGAGGSARAVLYSLRTASWQIVILARNPRQSEELAAEFQKIENSACSIVPEVLNFERLKHHSQDANLIVNTTPLGMHPNPETNPWPDGLPFPKYGVVYDLVYNPLETRLVQNARAQGLLCSNGAGMLISQAALAFSIWTGLEPPFEVMGRAFPGYMPD